MKRAATRIASTFDSALIRSPDGGGRIMHARVFGFAGKAEAMPMALYSGTTAGAAMAVASVLPAGAGVGIKLAPVGYTDAGVTVAVTAEASFDGGQNWTPYGGATFTGGAALAKDGVSTGRRWFGFFPAALPTHVRFTTVVTGGSVRKSVELAGAL
jgi:hypothetical protein